MRKRLSTNTYRKPALFLQKSPKISGNLWEVMGECQSRNPVLQFPLSSSPPPACAAPAGPATSPAARRRSRRPGTGPTCPVRVVFVCMVCLLCYLVHTFMVSNLLHVQTLMLTDAQTPFLGTPLVPLKVLRGWKTALKIRLLI